MTRVFDDMRAKPGEVLIQIDKCDTCNALRVSIGDENGSTTITRRCGHVVHFGIFSQSVEPKKITDGLLDYTRPE